jgi:hypothetical protein
MNKISEDREFARHILNQLAGYIEDGVPGTLFITEQTITPDGKGCCVMGAAFRSMLPEMTSEELFKYVYDNPINGPINRETVAQEQFRKSFVSKTGDIDNLVSRIRLDTESSFQDFFYDVIGWLVRTNDLFGEYVYESDEDDIYDVRLDIAGALRLVAQTDRFKIVSANDIPING